MDETEGKPTAPTVVDWRAGGFGNSGIVIIEKMSDGTYRVGDIIGPDDVVAFKTRRSAPVS